MNPDRMARSIAASMVMLAFVFLGLAFWCSAGDRADWRDVAVEKAKKENKKL